MLDLNSISEWVMGAFGVLLTVVGFYIRKAQIEQASKTQEQREILYEILKQVKSSNERLIALEVWRDHHKEEVVRIMDSIHHEFKEVWQEIRRD